MRLDDILKALTQDERRKVLKVIRIGGSNLRLAGLLTTHGHDITEASIRRWRTKREQT